jgi:hypothetical protein
VWGSRLQHSSRLVHILVDLDMDVSARDACIMAFVLDTCDILLPERLVLLRLQFDYSK